MRLLPTPYGVPLVTNTLRSVIFVTAGLADATEFNAMMVTTDGCKNPETKR